MFADMLNAPVAELTMSDHIDACEDFVDARTLVFLKAVLEDVLNHQATSFSQCDLMPHAAEGLVDVLHDLWRRVAPAELEQLLPDVARIAVNDCLRDTTKKLVHHDCFVFLRHRVEGLLDNVAAESIHAEIECVPADSLSNSNNLLRRTMLEAALDQEVTKAVDHKWVCLIDDSVHDLELLVYRTDLELLLQEDGCLLVVVADDLVHDILPVARHVTIEETAIVQWLSRAHVSGGLHLWSVVHGWVDLREVCGSRGELGADWSVHVMSSAIGKCIRRLEAKRSDGRSVSRLEVGTATKSRVWTWEDGRWLVSASR